MALEGWPACPPPLYRRSGQVEFLAEARVEPGPLGFSAHFNRVSRGMWIADLFKSEAAAPFHWHVPTRDVSEAGHGSSCLSQAGHREKGSGCGYTIRKLGKNRCFCATADGE